MQMETTYLDFLCKLIRLQTVSDDVEAVDLASRAVYDVLEKNKLYCEMERTGDRLCVFAATQKTKTPDILLCAHLDVVPAENDSQFEPVIKDGYLYARGSDDCLGNAVTAMKILLEAPADASIGCIFTTDEEIGGSTTAEMVARGYGAERMIILLDAGCGIYYAQKGSLSLLLTAHGKGGHSSAPWNYDNPILKLAEGILRLKQEWPDPKDTEDWRISMVPTVFNAGSVHNRIPDDASVLVNFRTVNADDKDTIIDTIKKLTDFDVENQGYCAPVTLPADSPDLALLQKAYSKHFNTEAIPRRMAGATDARHFTTLGKPIFITGVTGSGAHEKNEYLFIDSINQMTQTILDLVRKN